MADQRMRMYVSLQKLSREEVIQFCRGLLEVMHSSIQTAECDVLTIEPDWPQDVRQAIDRLRRFDTLRAPLDPGFGTGSQPVGQQSVWQDFADASPFVEHMSFFDGEDDVVCIEEMGGIIVVDVTRQEYRRVIKLHPAVRLIKLAGRTQKIAWMIRGMASRD